MIFVYNSDLQENELLLPLNTHSHSLTLFNHRSIETATSSIEQNGNFAKEAERRRVMLEMGEAYPTGSRVPDCSHACGPCFPCRRVMVSYNCLLSESCPISYRCMCHGRYYHIPSY